MLDLVSIPNLRSKICSNLQFLQKLSTGLYSERPFRIQILNLPGNFTYFPWQLVIPKKHITGLRIRWCAKHNNCHSNLKKLIQTLLGIIFSLLNIILSHHLHLMKVVIRFPINEVNFLEQLLLMVFQFPNHYYLFLWIPKNYTLFTNSYQRMLESKVTA